MRRLALGLLAVTAGVVCPAASARVLRVGTYRGIPGEFRSIQSAINAANPGDWILIGPGDYKTPSTKKVTGGHGDDRAGAGVVITTPGLWLRGMNRNRVWVDGTKSGPRCSAAASDQVFGPKDAAGKPSGRDGILVYKAPNVIVENLSACNFLNGDMGAGNEIWWDADQSTGLQASLGTWWGSYLTATSTYYKDANSASASYGIYSDNTRAPGHGEFYMDYASNMNDSSFYVGGCPDCQMTLNHVHAENSPQGYSGTNAGGHLLVENSEWDNNTTGFATGDLNNDDQPSPQNGNCPNHGTNPYVTQSGLIQRTYDCWTFINNYVHDNNNGNVPVQGIAGLAIPGTGMTIYGGRNDVFVKNRFVNNGAWGIIFVPFPDTETPPAIAHCGGGTDLSTPSQPLCFFDDWGSEFAHNTFTHNGFFGNPSNGDIGEYSQQGENYNADSNCFHDNIDTSGTLSTAPSNLDNNNHCGQNYTTNSNDPNFDAQVACASQALFPCPPHTVAHYPAFGTPPMKLPGAQPTMPNPCAGAPPNAWCSGQVTKVKACVRGSALHVRALLVTHDRLKRFTARARGHTYVAHRHVVKVPLRRHHGRLRVRFTERIKVGRSSERFSFTRVYRLCK
jgi:hypothetical protein